MGLSRIVRAGGGVVWRHGPGGLEVLLIHRPRYGDWSFPKGKADRGETDEEAAVREVEEEVGLRLVLGPELASTRYRDSKGRRKIVRYWAMELPYGGEEPFAGDGVDEVRWVDFDEAGRHLTWERDLVVLDSLPVEQLV